MLYGTGPLLSVTLRNRFLPQPLRMLRYSQIAESIKSFRAWATYSLRQLVREEEMFQVQSQSSLHIKRTKLPKVSPPLPLLLACKRYEHELARTTGSKRVDGRLQIRFDKTHIKHG